MDTYYPDSMAGSKESAAGGSFFAGEGAGLISFLRQIRRRKSIIGGTVALICSFVLLVLFQLTPLYTAKTYLMIDSRQSQVVDIEQVLSGLAGDSESIRSEVKVITSRGLATKVIAKLGLMNDPEFNSALKPRPGNIAFLNPFSYLPDEWKAALFGENTDDSEAARRESTRIRTINAFLSRLKVEPEGRSRIIEVAFSSESADKAAQIANAVSELYLVEQLEVKFDATRRATEWLNTRVEDLRAKVEASEQAVEVFRKQSGLVQGKGTSLASQQISELNTQLILSNSKRVEAEARLRQVENLLNSVGGAESAAEVLSSTLIQRLREQEAEVQRKKAELDTEYGPRHPRMVNVNAEIDDLQNKIRQEVAKIVTGLRNEVGVSRAREDSLASGLERLKVEVSALNSSEVRLRALEREANANRSLFESFLGRLKETTSQTDVQQADARIISPADTPQSPAFPKKRIIMLVVFIGALVIGVALAALIEHLDHGFRSADELEKIAGVSALGLIPAVNAKTIGKLTLPDYIVQKPRSTFAESLRTVHTGILLSNVDNPPKVILVTSSVPGEGKSTISMSLARVLARTGKSVALVDADLRRPTIADSMGLKQKPGLVDVLSGQVTLEDALQADKVVGLDILTAGSHGPSPIDLLGSDLMKRLLQRLTAEHDVVIIDSAPVLAVSDSRVLARMADTTLFVVRWAHTRRETALSGLKQMAGTHSNLAGVVLTQVNVRKHAQYGYGDSGYYHGHAAKYYAD